MLSFFLFIFFFYVQDNIDSKSDFDDDNKSASGFSVVSNFDNIEPLGDISPDALWDAPVPVMIRIKITCNSFIHAKHN